MAEHRENNRVVALGVLGAFAYATTTLCARGALRAGADLPALLAVRFALTGVVMLAVLVVLRRPLLPAPGERLLTVGLGTCTLAVESACYFEALSRGTVAGVAPLFYSHVAIIAVVEVVLGAMRLTWRVVAAVLLGIVGGVVIAGSGGPASIQATGVAFAMASSCGYALYALASGRLVRRTDPLTAATWVAFGAAGGIGLWGVLRGGFGTLPGTSFWSVAAMAVGTAAAFALWFLVVGRLGSSRTAIIMILEAPMGIALTAAVFGDAVSLVILVGGALVLAGAGLAAVEVPDEIEAIEAATPP